MQTYAEPKQKDRGEKTAGTLSISRDRADSVPHPAAAGAPAPASQFQAMMNNRPAAMQLKRFEQMANRSPQMRTLAQLQLRMNRANTAASAGLSQNGTQATMQRKEGIPVNDDQILEREADVMGARAMQMRRPSSTSENSSDHGRGNDSVVQRKIAINNELFSFQQLYDEHGNPFLLSHKDDKLKRLQLIQNGLLLDDETKGGFLPLNEKTQENLSRNLGYGRPVNVETEEGEKSSVLPFKSYTFNRTTPFEVAVFPETGKGVLYPELETQMQEDLDTNLENVTEEVNPVLDRVEKVEQGMTTLIFAENYRVPGAKKVFDDISEKGHKEIQASAEDYRKRKRLKEEGPEAKKEAETKIKDSVSRMSSKLPWAGSKGKDKFKKQVEKGDWDRVLDAEDKKRVVPSGDWYDIKSPLRDDEKDIFG